MTPQGLLRLEAPPADAAAERPAVRVDELMGLQTRLRFERLLAVLAPEVGVSLLFVSQQVLLQAVCVPELPGALVAGEQPLLFVSVHVLHQVKPAIEALLAEVTHEHLPFSRQHRFLRVSGIRVLQFGDFCSGKIHSSF